MQNYTVVSRVPVMFVLVPVRGVHVQLDVALQCAAADVYHRVLKIRPRRVTAFARVNHPQRLTRFCFHPAAPVEQALPRSRNLFFVNIAGSTERQLCPSFYTLACTSPLLHVSVYFVKRFVF